MLHSAECRWCRWSWCNIVTEVWRHFWMLPAIIMWKSDLMASVTNCFSTRYPSSQSELICLRGDKHRTLRGAFFMCGARASLYGRSLHKLVEASAFLRDPYTNCLSRSGIPSSPRLRSTLRIDSRAVLYCPRVCRRMHGEQSH